MSGQPFGDPKSNPQLGATPAESPELLDKANSAFNLAIGGLFVAICCCGVIGLVMGVIAMNNAGSVITLAAPGSAANAKANTAKTLGIVAIAIGAVKIFLELGGGAMNMMNR